MCDVSDTSVTTSDKAIITTDDLEQVDQVCINGNNISSDLVIPYGTGLNQLLSLGNTAVLKIFNETQYVKTGDQGLYGEVLEISSGYVRIKQTDKIVILSIADPNMLNNAPAPTWQNE